MDDIINEVAKCKSCKKRFSNPVFLECGHTICEEHTLNTNKVWCSECSQDYKLNKTNKRPRNLILESLLEKNLDKLNFNNLEPYKNATDKLDKLNDLVKKYDNSRENMEILIDEYFSKIKNQIDLKKEELLLKITNTADKLIREVDSYQAKCKQNVKKFKCKTMPQSILDIKVSLSEMNEKIKQLVIDEEAWTSIASRAEEQFDQLETLLNQNTNEMFLGKVEKLKFEQNILNLDDLFCKDIGFNTKCTGSFKLKINSISTYKNIKERTKVDNKSVHLINNLPFKIEAFFSQNEESQVVLELYLKCLFGSSIKNWSINIDFTLSVLDVTLTNKVKSRTVKQHCFKQPNDWGFKGIASLEYILDTKNNVYNANEDSIVVECSIDKLNLNLA